MHPCARSRAFQEELSATKSKSPSLASTLARQAASGEHTPPAFLLAQQLPIAMGCYPQWHQAGQRLGLLPQAQQALHPPQSLRCYACRIQGMA